MVSINAESSRRNLSVLSFSVRSLSSLRKLLNVSGCRKVLSVTYDILFPKLHGFRSSKKVWRHPLFNRNCTEDEVEGSIHKQKKQRPISMYEPRRSSRIKQTVANKERIASPDKPTLESPCQAPASRRLKLPPGAPVKPKTPPSKSLSVSVDGEILDKENKNHTPVVTSEQIATGIISTPLAAVCTENISLASKTPYQQDSEEILSFHDLKTPVISNRSSSMCQPYAEMTELSPGIKGAMALLDFNPTGSSVEDEILDMSMSSFEDEDVLKGNAFLFAGTDDFPSESTEKAVHNNLFSPFETVTEQVGDTSTTTNAPKETTPLSTSTKSPVSLDDVASFDCDSFSFDDKSILDMDISLLGLSDEQLSEMDDIPGLCFSPDL